jgi:hypothetical protein
VRFEAHPVRLPAQGKALQGVGFQKIWQKCDLGYVNGIPEQNYAPVRFIHIGGTRRGVGFGSGMGQGAVGEIPKAS